MVTIPELRLNTCEQVSIPKPSELFARFGYTKMKGATTGDEVVHTDLSKVEQVAQVAKIAFENE